jgi:photosystem II stability/assembly factor-like uncharacterized protein
VAFTTNLGLSWTDISSGLPVGSIFYDIDFKINGAVKEVFITGNQNYIYKTTNFGVLWDTVGFKGNVQQFTAIYRSTDLLGGDTLVTVGNFGLINKRFSISNRVSYLNRIKMAGQLGSLDLWVENENGKIWVVGQPTNSSFFDQIIYSSNGGVTWEVQPTNSTATFTSICMLNTSTGYVAGFNGNVLKTTNGGLSWDQLPSPSSNYIFKVDFVNVNTGWVFGEVFRFKLLMEA